MCPGHGGVRSHLHLDAGQNRGLGDLPIIFMRAQKNSVEQAGMRRAHVRDGAAICEALSNMEARYNSEQWTEEKIKYEVELWRLSQKHAKGLSLRTVVAYGEHSALPYYISSNVTNIEVSDQSLLVIESGGQYLEGTTDVSRTFIFGEPTQEMKKAYTNVLADSALGAAQVSVRFETI